MTVMRTFTFMLSVFIVGIVEMVVAGVMNLMSTDLNVSEAWIGQLVTIYAFTFAISGPILVKLTENYSPRYVLLWTIAAFVIGNLMIAISPNFIILIIGRILSSAAAALIVVKILAVTVALTRPENRGKMLGIVYTGFSGANVFGVPIGTLIGDWLGWRYTFGMIMLAGVLAGILLSIYLPKHITMQSESSTSSMTQTIHSKKQIVKLLAITFIILTANSLAYIYINPLILSGGHTIQFVSLALLLIGVAGMIGTAMGGYLTDRLSPKLWLLISVACFIVVILILNQLWSATILLLLVLFLWHIIQWSTNPAIQSGLIDEVQGDHSQVMSWNMSILNAGIGFGALVGGVIVSTISLFATLYISAILGIIALIIVFTLKPRHT